MAAPEYVRGVVLELGHVDTTATPTDVPWGKTEEESMVLTPGNVAREFKHTGQDYGPVDSQRLRVEGSSVRFQMAQADPLTMARTLGLPDSAVTGTGATEKLKVKQQDLGGREFHLYAIVETSTGLRRLDIPRAVVTETNELNFAKGSWASPGCTMALLQAPAVGAGEEPSFWEWSAHVPGE